MENVCQFRVMFHFHPGSGQILSQGWPHWLRDDSWWPFTTVEVKTHVPLKCVLHYTFPGTGDMYLSLQVYASDKAGWCFRVEWEARCGIQKRKKSGDCTALTCNSCTVPEIREKQPTVASLGKHWHFPQTKKKCGLPESLPHTHIYKSVNTVQTHLNNFNEIYSMWKLRDTQEWASAKMGHRYCTVNPKGRAHRKANLPPNS